MTQLPETSPSRSPVGTSGRRRFLVIVTWVGSLVAALVTLVPGLAFLVGPARRKEEKVAGPVRIASLRDLQPGRPTRVDVVATEHDAWSRMDGVRRGAVWLVRGATGDEVTAFSTVCPHLGCAIDAGPAGDGFVCPCHGSAFALDGRRVAGPSPRGMDELDVLVKGDDVAVVYRRFKEDVDRKEPA